MAIVLAAARLQFKRWIGEQLYVSMCLWLGDVLAGGKLYGFFQQMQSLMEQYEWRCELSIPLQMWHHVCGIDRMHQWSTLHSTR